MLEVELKDRYDVKDSSFNLLFSLYAFPNIILPFIGGILMDKIGLRPSLMIFLSMSTVGYLLFSISVGISSFALALVSRILFALGSVSVYVGTVNFISTWFSDQQIAFALAISVVFQGAADVVKDNLVPYVNKEHGLTVTFWMCFGVCLFSLICGIVLIVIDLLSSNLSSGVIYIYIYIYIRVNK